MKLVEKLSAIFKHGILKNILWLSFDKIFRLLLSLVVGAAVARYLGPLKWGQINYVLAYISIAITVVTMGLDGFLIKGLLEYPERKNELLGTAFILRCFLVFISLLSNLLIFSIVHVDSDTFIILLCLFFNVVVSPFDLIDIDYQSTLSSKKTIKAKGLAYIFGAIFKVLAIVFEMPVTVFAAILGLEAVLAALLLIGKYQMRDGNLKLWRFKALFVKYLIKNGWPFFLSAISVVLYMRLDQIMLGNLLTIQKVGEFTAAVRITEIFLFLPLTITGSFYAALLSAQSNSEELFSKRIQSLFQLMFVISFIVALGVFIFSDLIVLVLYGRSFIATSTILRIHIWSLLAVFLGVAANQYLVIKNRQKIIFYCTAIGLVSNVLLNMYFIPRSGSIGAAWATILSYCLAAIFSNLLFKGSRSIFLYQVKSLLVLVRPKVLLDDLRSMRS